MVWAIYVGWSGLSCESLVRHAEAVEESLREGDLEGGRKRVGHLVGRDTRRMDEAGCRRACIESLAENLVDGVISPLIYLSIGGVEWLVGFKVVSTLDSMIGYKTEKYEKFGYISARLDDGLNYIPSRLSWVLTALLAALWGNGKKVLRIGYFQAGLFSSPNSGWSESSFAGALDLKLVGKIEEEGKEVVNQWIGDAEDREGGTEEDVKRAMDLVYWLSGLVFLGLWGLMFFFE